MSFHTPPPGGRAVWTSAAPHDRAPDNRKSIVITLERGVKGLLSFGTKIPAPGTAQEALEIRATLMAAKSNYERVIVNYVAVRSNYERVLVNYMAVRRNYRRANANYTGAQSMREHVKSMYMAAQSMCKHVHALRRDEMPGFEQKSIESDKNNKNSHAHKSTGVS